MSLTSIGYGDTFPVRFEEYISGILIPVFPPHLCRLHLSSTPICYDVIPVRFGEYFVVILYQIMGSWYAHFRWALLRLPVWFFRWVPYGLS